MTPIRTTIRRLGLSGGVATVALLALAGPAAAHVTVSSDDATAGGDGKVTFRVPNESVKAGTTKVLVTVPSSVVFTEVAAQAKPGWTAHVREVKLAKPAKVMGSTVTRAVRTITWIATGAGIPVGGFDEFSVAAEPFPQVKTIQFHVAQTYADGTVVNWNQHGSEDQVEHPAPTLALIQPVVAPDGGSASLNRLLALAALGISLAALFGVMRQNRHRATST